MTTVQISNDLIDKLIHENHALFRQGKDYLLCQNLIDGYIYFKDSKLNLVTNKIELSSEEDIRNFFAQMSLEKLNNSSNAQIILTDFNLSYFLSSLNSTYNFKADDILFIALKFADMKTYDLADWQAQNIDLEALEINLQQDLSTDSYRELFQKVYDDLQDGEYYQFNLTHLFSLKFKCDFSQIYKKFLSSRKHSEFFHIINLPGVLEFISNSPECLFEINGNELFTRPIKGTASDTKNIDEFKRDVKNNSELDIITDLLRNDLSQIGPHYSELVDRCEIFYVPGLVHLYSKVKVIVEKTTTLLDLLSALHPGGSITGAPKKRVLEKLSLREVYKRGFYTGSTLLFYKDHQKASINIRSAYRMGESEESFKYGSGGGITLLSEARDEFGEMKAKLSSFLSLFS